jgi:hypothetical protein
MFTLQTSLKPLLIKGGGGKLLVEVTVNSKEGNTLSQIRPRIRPLGSIQATSDAVESDGGQMKQC